MFQKGCEIIMSRNWNENEDMEPMLSLERAEEILRNVYRAAGMEPPNNCTDILRKGQKNIKKRHKEA